MAISHVGSTPWDSGPNAVNSTNQTIPSTATTGRLIVLAVYFGTAASTFTWPTGFTQRATRSTPGTYAVATKVAASGDASLGVTISASGSANGFTGHWSIYDGVDTTTPIATSTSNNGGTMSTTSLTVLAVTTEVANSFMYATSVAPVTCTHTTGTMTERVDSTATNNTWSRAAADEDIAAVGSTGARTITTSASTASWTTLAMSIRPAAAVTASFIWATETPYRILSRR